MDQKDIENACYSILEKSRIELLSKSQEQLEEYWYFDFHKKASTEWYTYEFFKALDLYSSFCREWEEERNGCVCLVERIREKYILPKIRIYLEHIKVMK